MRYRRLDAQGDMVFGQQQADFLIDVPQAVAQAVHTRLQLQLGAWFLDITDGMDWKGKVLGNRTDFVRDATIRERVLTTTGVTEIDGYNSGADPNLRAFAAQMTLNTIYGRFEQLRHIFLVPSATAQPRIPEVPAVTVTVLSDTSLNVDW